MHSRDKTGINLRPYSHTLSLSHTRMHTHTHTQCYTHTHIHAHTPLQVQATQTKAGGPVSCSLREGSASSWAGVATPGAMRCLLHSSETLLPALSPKDSGFQ